MKKRYKPEIYSLQMAKETMIKRQTTIEGSFKDTAKRMGKLHSDISRNSSHRNNFDAVRQIKKSDVFVLGKRKHF